MSTDVKHYGTKSWNVREEEDMPLSTLLFYIFGGGDSSSSHRESFDFIVLCWLEVEVCEMAKISFTSSHELIWSWIERNFFHFRVDDVFVQNKRHEHSKFMLINLYGKLSNNCNETSLEYRDNTEGETFLKYFYDPKHIFLTRRSLFL